MNYKIAFTDIDGTLLNAKREPSPLLIDQVGSLMKKDIPFILISSRMPQAMTWIQDMLGVSGQPLVAYNGGLVIVDGVVVHSRSIDVETIRAVSELRRGTGLSVQLFHGAEWYVSELDHYAKREENNTRVTPALRPLDATIADWAKRGVGAHKIMVMGPEEELSRMQDALANTYGERLHLYRSKADYLEIADKQISKLTGIEMVLAAKYPEFTLSDCIAFGDNYNDIEMLAGVGLGVAVGNARKEVIAAADVTVENAKEDGVARALKKYFA